MEGKGGETGPTDSSRWVGLGDTVRNTEKARKTASAFLPLHARESISSRRPQLFLLNTRKTVTPCKMQISL